MTRHAKAEGPPPLWSADVRCELPRGAASRRASRSGQRIARGDHASAKPVHRKVAGIQRDDEVGAAILGTGAERLVSGIRRESAGGADTYGFSRLRQQVDDATDCRTADLQPAEDVTVLVEDVHRDEPRERATFDPAAKQARAGVLQIEWFIPEGRDAGDQH